MKILKSVKKVCNLPRRVFAVMRRHVSSSLRANQLNRKYLSWSKTPQEFVRENHIAPLSREEKSKIDAYWKQFGIHHKDYSAFQMYYEVTGKKDPRFISSGLADCVLAPYYNDRTKVLVWTDKNYFSRFLPDMKFPEMLGQKINGKLYDCSHRCYLAEEMSMFCASVWNECEKKAAETIIIKQTVSSFQGKGVKKYSIRTEEDLLNAVDEWKDSIGFIIQKAIEQHPFFAQLNDSSVNIIRITTLRRGKEILALAPCIRFGLPGYYTDVAFVNGKEIVNCVGILPDGRIADHYVSMYGEKGPICVNDTVVPKWQEIVELVKEGHRNLELFGLVAWDMTVDKDGKIICVEYNLRSPGVLTYQLVHGPIAGEATDDMLDFLKDEWNQEAFLPNVIKLKKPLKRR